MKAVVIKTEPVGFGTRTRNFIVEKNGSVVTQGMSMKLRMNPIRSFDGTIL